MLFILVLFITGCASQEKKHFKAQQFYLENKKELSTLCSSEFPIRPQYIKGDTIKKTEVVYLQAEQVECPDGTKQDCPPPKHIKETRTITDTIKVPDLATESKLRHEINELTSDNTLLYKEKESVLKDLKTVEKENKNLKKYIAGLILVLFISLVVIIKK